MKALVPWKWGRRDDTPALANSWFDRFDDEPFEGFLPWFAGSAFGRSPAVDVSEDANEVAVRVEIPGMSEKDLNVTYNDGYLRICGEKKNEHEEKKGGRYVRECSYGSFERDVPVGTDVAWDKATAKYKNGVLTVKMPRKEPGREKRVKIEVR